MTEPTPHILHESDVRDVVESEITEHQVASWTSEQIDDRARDIVANAPSSSTITEQLTDAAGGYPNVNNKQAGKMFFNTTTGKPVWATGPVNTDPWVTADGVTAHTPV
jgi:hypothetical protein